MDSISQDDSCDLALLQLQQHISSADSFSSTENVVNPARSLRKPSNKKKGGKRSPRACAACRARKVRCNVTACGIPCSNCMFDDVQCALPAVRRGKVVQESSETRGTTNSQGIGTTRRENGGSKSNTHPENQYHCSEAYSLKTVSLPGAHSQDVERLSEAISKSSSRTVSWVQSPLASATSTTNSSLPSHPGSSLSRIFTPFPSHVDAGNLSYLKSQDALTLPSEDLQVELLKAYIEFVHGILPVLDLEEFLTIVKYGSGDVESWEEEDESYDKPVKNQISFLLFQAVLFAGVGYVSTRVLKEAGYRSRESAKIIFFHRVKTLYDFDVCDDRLSIIQSLLLMTLCPRMSHRETKDAWHWLGLAISLCFVLGLNRSLPFSNKRLRQKHLERRIWWIAFVRDRTLSLRSSFAFMRPVRIKKEDSKITMLGLEDFDLDENSDRYEGLDELRMRIIAVECVEKVMICWCSEDKLFSSLSAVYVPQARYSALTSIHRNSDRIQQRDLSQIMAREEPFQTNMSNPACCTKEETPVHSLGRRRGVSMTGDQNMTDYLDINDPTKNTTGQSLLDPGYNVQSEYEDFFQYFESQEEAGVVQVVDYGVGAGIEALDFGFTATFDDISGSSVAE